MHFIGPKPAIARPEHELILCCVRTKRDYATSRRITQLLEAKLNWNYLISIATHHRVIPLLYVSLNEISQKTVPGTILAELQAIFHTNVANSLALTHELLNILDLLKVNNIPAIPFKGPVLAASTYGNLALRQFTDLDILIHKKDAFSVKELLLSEGYRRVSPSSLTNAQELIYLRAACEYRFISQDGRVALEPHWGFTQTKLGVFFDIDALWQRLGKVEIAGTITSSLSPEDTLLVACINGTKDRWSSLKPICDVAELIRTHSHIDWSSLVEQAHTIGCKRLLLLGLFLANELLEAELPDTVWQGIDSDFAIKKLASEVQKQLFNRCPQQPKRIGANFSLWEIQVRERLQDKVWYLWNLVFGPNEADVSFLALPTILFWAYPFLRPLRLAFRVGSSLTRIKDSDFLKRKNKHFR